VRLLVDENGNNYTASSPNSGTHVRDDDHSKMFNISPQKPFAGALEKNGNQLTKNPQQQQMSTDIRRSSSSS